MAGKEDCNELADPVKLVSLCQKSDSISESKVLNCMRSLFLGHFKGIYRGRTISSTLYTVDEQLETAFDNGLQLFYNRLKYCGWEERGASIKTALLKYCENQLKALTKNILRERKKPSAGEPDNAMDVKSSQHTADSPLSILEDKEMREQEEEILRKAFLLLDEKCRDFILWNLKKTPDEEMQQKYPDVLFSQEEIDKSKEPNKELQKKIRKRHDIPFRCKEKLKGLVDSLLQNRDKR